MILRHPGYRRIAAMLAATSISGSRARRGCLLGRQEGPLQRLVQSLDRTGRQGHRHRRDRVAALLAISESGHAMKKFLTIIFALCVASPPVPFGFSSSVSRADSLRNV